MIQFIKFCLIFFFILLYMLQATLLWLVTRDTWALRKKLLPLISAYCRIGLKIMGFKVEVTGSDEVLKAGPYLVASNHMSYLDVLILASQLPGSFVTSQEIRETPFLGQLCLLGGCLFVERRDKTNIHREISELTEALGRGMNVIFFPEATSTNGERILRFRKPLFQSAINSSQRVLPVCLNYVSIDGEPVTLQNRDRLCWYGDMPFAPHLWRLMKAREVKVEIQILNWINPQSEDTQKLAEWSQSQVERVFRPVRVDCQALSPAQ